MSRRISSWKKILGNAVIGRAMQDLGDDCFAIYCSAFVYENVDAGMTRWTLVLERAGFAPQQFHAERRIDAMMKAEAVIAAQWSEYGILRHIAANPEAYRDPRSRPGAIPVTDCKKFPFWQKKPAFGPQDLPAYMKNLPPELLQGALADSQVARRDDE